jgi:hypothetical protein
VLCHDAKLRFAIGLVKVRPLANTLHNGVGEAQARRIDFNDGPCTEMC